MSYVFRQAAECTALTSSRGTTQAIDSAMPTELIEPDNLAATEPADESLYQTHCTGCNTSSDWNGATCCPHCGFYPALGRTVRTPDLQENHAESLLDLVPDWAPLLAAGVLVIVIECVAARMLFEPGPLRTAWGLGHLAAGLVIFFFAHIRAFVLKATGTESAGIGQFWGVIGVWRSVLADLPDTKAVMIAGVLSLAAAVLGPTIVGGSELLAITGLGGTSAPAAVKRTPLSQATGAASSVAQKKQSNQPATLQEAMNDFSDQAAGDIIGEDPDIDALEAADELPTIDCVIIGYVPGPDRIRSLHLAALIDGKALQYVGQVAAGALPADVVSQLESQFERNARSRPFIRVPTAGKWLDPVALCRVQYQSRTSASRLVGAKFMTLLDDRGEPASL